MTNLEDHRVVTHDSVKDPWPVDPGSVSVVVTSLPYWGRRSYGDDDGETGRPGQRFIEYMADCRRWTTHAWDALADDGLMFVNVGDVSSKSGGAGGDYSAGGRKAGQRRYRQGESGLPRMQYMNLPGKLVDMLQGPLRKGPNEPEYADGPRWLFRCEIVWDKSPTVRAEDIRHARRQLEAHEKILVFAKTPDHRYFGERATEQGNVWHFAPVHSSKKNPAPVWRQGPLAGEKHPAPFPLELPRRCLEVSVNPGELVVDPFHGSGTTGTAAQMFGCRYVGLDLYV